MLDAAAGLRPLARLAGSHGERCDGSGYHRGSRSAELPLTAWLLATADCYHALGEPRPHRRAMTASAAASELSREAQAGRLEADAVHAVLAAAGQEQPYPSPADRPPPGPRPAKPEPIGHRPMSQAGHASRPAGLSERECEVLGLLAKGLATKQVARRLGISPKTCDHHIQRLYGKAGVSTRAGATLFALEHGLVRPDETAIR